MEKKILLVDDDKINGEMLSKRLTKRGFIVDMVHSGQAALEYLDYNKPHIILLDILMPDMSGIDVLVEIRKKYSQIEISIMMVTAKSEVSDVVEALKLGANDYIQKPVNIEIAVARLNTQHMALQSHQDAVDKNELEALNAMIATYNHEINNPLTIAFGFLWKLKKEYRPDYILQVEDALNRVVNIVKQIDNLSSGKGVKETYASNDKIFKL